MKRYCDNSQRHVASIITPKEKKAKQNMEKILPGFKLMFQKFLPQI